MGFMVIGGARWVMMMKREELCCPRHGDVSKAVKRYEKTGQLTDEYALDGAGEEGEGG
jgi:hypothetical protein